jgi:hypothetical protein
MGSSASKLGRKICATTCGTLGPGSALNPFHPEYSNNFSASFSAPEVRSLWIFLKENEVGRMPSSGGHHSVSARLCEEFYIREADSLEIVSAGDFRFTQRGLVLW